MVQVAGVAQHMEQVGGFAVAGVALKFAVTGGGPVSMLWEVVKPIVVSVLSLAVNI